MVQVVAGGKGGVGAAVEQGVCGGRVADACESGDWVPSRPAQRLHALVEHALVERALVEHALVEHALVEHDSARARGARKTAAHCTR